ncbi:MAG: rod shape-determining protein RodA [Lachnospiraceae bacterium]|jgi:rod shape determining protein RodA|nr:rod shape-determining protein RodA [Lachnospiraceae bacterium]
MFNLRDLKKKYFKNYSIKNYSFLLLGLVIILTIFGIIVIGSAKQSVQLKQVIGLALGLIGCVVVSLIDYNFILNFYWLIYGAAIVLLGSLFIPHVGENINGATRWINLGFMQFQPSEFAKVLLILFLAKFIQNHEEDINNYTTMIKTAIFCGIPLFLILIEPNLSTTIFTALLLVSIIIVGGLHLKYIGIVIVAIIPIMIIFLAIVVQPNQKLLKDYQRNRIMAFIEPEKYASTGAYQQNNSVMAIGSGKLSGKGLNNNTTTSVKNGNFILEPQTDFIFAIIGEELGFIGGIFVIALLLLIVLKCMVIGGRAPDLAGKLICMGVAAWIAFQGFINIGVATKLLPNTGVPLPFVSYGISSLVSLYVGIGFVLNIGLHNKNKSKYRG